MKNTLHMLPGILLAGVLLVSSCQDTEDSKTIAEDQNKEQLGTKAAEKDAQFVVDVTASNYAEVELAQAAQQKSANQEIKDLAAMLESDHKMLIGQLKDYAGKNSIMVPDSATAEAQTNARDLAANNNAVEFDKKWCNELLDKHESTINKLESASNEVTDASLKTWIAEVLPKIRTHRDKLAACKNKLK